MNAETKPKTPEVKIAEPPAHPASGNPVVAALLAYLLFGLGHFYVGRRWKGASLFVLLMTIFVLGMMWGSPLYHAVDIANPMIRMGVNTILTAGGMVFAGVPYLVCWTFLPPLGEMDISTYEIGWTYVAAASLLNVLAMVDAWDIARGKKL